MTVRPSLVTVARAEPDDAPVFAALELGPDTRGFVGSNSEAEHRHRITTGEMIYLRIVDRSALAGFFILRLDPDGRSVEFRRVVVAPEHRGIGQAAITAMERYCRGELGRERIWLDVFEENPRARHVYQKLGYRHFGHDVFADGRPLLLFEKDLES